jgi:hypothetical protein
MPQFVLPQPPTLPDVDWTARVDYKTQNEIFKVITTIAKKK